jgi:hypothetical protein
LAFDIPVALANDKPSARWSDGRFEPAQAGNMVSNPGHFPLSTEASSLKARCGSLRNPGALAIEAKRDGIRVNVLTPSLIGDTDV